MVRQRVTNGKASHRSPKRTSPAILPRMPPEVAKICAAVQEGKGSLISSRELALQAVSAAFTKNALQPSLLDVSSLSSYTDFILVVSGQSIRQVEAIAEAIEQELKQEGHDPIGVEGGRGGQWMLLDYGSVVIHVFYHPMREFYDLEGLWSEAPRVKLEVPSELRVAQLYV